MLVIDTWKATKYISSNVWNTMKYKNTSITLFTPVGTLRCCGKYCDKTVELFSSNYCNDCTCNWSMARLRIVTYCFLYRSKQRLAKTNTSNYIRVGQLQGEISDNLSSRNNWNINNKTKVRTCDLCEKQIQAWLTIVQEKEQK